MKVLKFETVDDFSEFFMDADIEALQHVRSAIQEALDVGKKTAKVFELHFEDQEHIFTIDLPKSEWRKALENCLKQYEKEELGDEAIDTYLLMKRLD